MNVSRFGSLQLEEPEHLTQEELNNVEQAIDNQHPAQDIYAALSSLSKDKLLLLQKDLHDRMIRSDDCLSNCNRDVIPQLMAHANYINEEARLSGSTAYWIKLLPWSRHAWRWGHLLNAPPNGPEPPDLDPDPPDPDPPDEAQTAFALCYPEATRCL